jgi:aspartyl-tRNA(Asn)/glutamyl-tRNA(Gln) amidotransferase subunit C
MSVDKDNVIKIASLSKISFKDHEIEKILEDLNQIIDWVDQLAEVNTDEVSPTFSSFDNDKGMKKREDIINDGDYREDITKNAPNSEEGFFLVPKVID